MKLKIFKYGTTKIRIYTENKRTVNLTKTLKDVDYIILSPGISLRKSKNKKNLIKYKNKIITDLDLFFFN